MAPWNLSLSDSLYGILYRLSFIIIIIILKDPITGSVNVTLLNYYFIGSYQVVVEELENKNWFFRNRFK